MTTINWQGLRPLDSSQNKAFEELCCQLADYEQAPPGSSFVRKGSPDAGVECYWRLPNGDEWGWQAKFFLSTIETSQWCQLDDSVKKALKKHPRLTKYTICLPIDRSDPRIGKQKGFMDKWNEHEAKWKEWAQKKGMAVEFPYWGKHEILERLSREEHRGRYFFWFNKESFSQQWFVNHVEEAVANIGPRYTPELNVELPIACLFDGLGRTSEFYKRIKVLYGGIKRAHSKSQTDKAEKVAKQEFDSLRGIINQCLSILGSVGESEIDHIDFDSLNGLASKSRELAWKCIKSLENIIKEEKKKGPQGKSSLGRTEDYGYERYLLKLTGELNELGDFTESSEARLSNVPALLLVGDAGIGKTHLFCDVAKQRVQDGLPTVLLLGGQFNDSEDPWSQIIRLLSLSCTKDEFLGALEAAAQARGAKAIILIDALNEGEGKNLWNKHLAGMLTTLSRYPWVGIALSVRTSYENTVIPNGLITNKLIRAIHHGFVEHEYQATRTFFGHYHIQSPTVPLLTPEFQNPLFLKLFCLGLKNRGLTKVPQGLQGITAILSFFVESINEKLSKPEYLDFDPKSRIVQMAVEKLAATMADEGKQWLPREKAQTTVNAFLPRGGYDKSLFRHLISEGLLAEERFWAMENEWHDDIHFSYPRFTDHVVAKHLLDKHLDSTNPCKSFLFDQPLGSFLKDERACWQNRGLIDALSIQLPERIKNELAEVAPHCAKFQPVLEAFVESLIWRDPKAISEATRNYINSYVIKYKDIHNQFLNALLTVASNPNHPCNADFLHKHLMKFKLAERDEWWSVFLHYQYGEHGAVDRLVDWAGSSEDRGHISDESIRLCGIALAWFLTTSNRFLRDKATKALVSLLEKRIHILRRIIGEFLGVNDPYVLERLFAVAYGCAMRSTDNKAVGELAKDVYGWIFKDGTPLFHILLRDYARGVIELALHRGCKLDIDIGKVRPPYKSEWLSAIPTEEELKKYGEWQEGMPDREQTQVRLYHSVMGGMSDFANYILAPTLNNWSSHHLNEPGKPSQKEMHYKNEHQFDLSIAKRWILKKVFDLGWTVERFGQFDNNLQRYSYNRGSSKSERIGKKYQWIAFHEFLARVSDNFEFVGDSWSDQPQKYEGPWQIGGIRDIDPSCLLRKTERETWGPHTNTWWFPTSYDAWNCEPDDEAWLEDSKDLPAIEPLIEVTNSDDGSRWLTLEGGYRWKQPTPPEEERFEIPRREIWYILKSYIVKKSDIDLLFDWAKRQNFWGRWMPESGHLTSVFLGEFFWSPAYKYHCSPYFGYAYWTRGDHNSIPKEVLVTVEDYLWEGGYDCSVDNAINIPLPCKWFVDRLDLRWNGVEGRLFDEEGNLIAFDPSVRTPGSSALLINRDAFLKFLNDNDYEILWTILSEKQIIGGRISGDDWKGRLEISGAFRIRAGQLEGKINPKFVSPRNR